MRILGALAEQDQVAGGMERQGDRYHIEGDVMCRLIPVPAEWIDADRTVLQFGLVYRLDQCGPRPH